jgi:hypothetical protein
MAVPKVRDERLCWLAVRDDLERRSRRRPGVALWWLGNRVAWWWSRWIPREVHDARETPVRRRMADYAFAVQAAARRLDPDERRVLRTTGQVPAWFLDEVERLRRAGDGGGAR